VCADLVAICMRFVCTDLVLVFVCIDLVANCMLFLCTDSVSFCIDRVATCV
jgi:hypothetical protein